MWLQIAHLDYFRRRRKKCRLALALFPAPPDIEFLNILNHNAHAGTLTAWVEENASDAKE